MEYDYGGNGDNFYNITNMNKHSHFKNDIPKIIAIKNDDKDYLKILSTIELYKENKNDIVLYFSFIRSYVKIINVTIKNLDIHNYFTIDYVSKYIIPEIEDQTSVLYRKPPKNLEAFKEVFLKIIPLSHCKIIVIDSLNQLFSISNADDTTIHDFFIFMKSINYKREKTIKKIILFYKNEQYLKSRYEELLKNEIGIQIKDIIEKII